MNDNNNMNNNNNMNDNNINSYYEEEYNLE